MPDSAPLPGVEEHVDWDTRVAGALAFLRRRITGDYKVDDFGFDPELTDRILLAPLRPLYKRWFRIETRGLENIPDTGGALLVANHSGTVAVDSMMTQLAIWDNHPEHRRLRMLGADFCLPVAHRLRTRAQRAGTRWPVRRTPNGCSRPASWWGCGPRVSRASASRSASGTSCSASAGVGSWRRRCGRKPRSSPVPSWALRRSTRSSATQSSWPGCWVRRISLITPTFPWLGPLGLVPLPSKWIIEFGEPIRTDEFPEGAADDPMLVFDLTDQVRETIQQTLYRLLVARRSVFF